MYMGRTFLIGVSLNTDYKIDSRLASTLALWDMDETYELFYSVTHKEEVGKSLGRDKIVQYAKYRVPNPTHILFLDPNIIPRKNTCRKLLECDKDIVFGTYPISHNGELKWSVKRDELVDIDKLPRTPFKVTAGGLGIVLIRYEVFEKLQWPYWNKQLSESDIVVTDEEYFGNKAAEAGFELWCEPFVKCDCFNEINRMNTVNMILKGHTK